MLTSRSCFVALTLLLAAPATAEVPETDPAEALVAAAPAAPAAPTARQEVRVRFGFHDGHGRLVLDWGESLPSYQVVQEGRTVRIAFERAATANPAASIARLADYLGGGELTDDGRTLRLDLKDGIKATVYPLQQRLLVNLRRTDAEAAAAPEAATASAAPAAGTPAAGTPTAGTPVADRAAARAPSPPKATNGRAVAIRVADDGAFSRIRFSDGHTAGFRIDRDGERVRVRFLRAERMDLSHLPATLPPRLAALPWDGDGVGFALAVNADARIRNYTDGSDLVLDVLGSPVRAETASVSPPAASAAVAATAPAVRAPEAIDAEAAAAALAAVAPAAGGEVAAVRRQGRTEVEHAGPRLAVGVVPTALGLRLEFPFAEAAGAAMFERAGYLWVVFSRPRALDLKAVQNAEPQLVGFVEQIVHADATAVRLRLRPGYHMALARSGDTWTATIEERAPPAPAVIRLTTELEAVGGARIFLSVPEPTGLLTLADPEVGDRLFVMPVATPGQGVPAGRQFVEFSLLRSLQGLALEPLADGLTVRGRADGVEVLGEQGLSVTEARVVPPPAAATAAPAGKRLLFPAAGDTAGTFVERRAAAVAAVGEGDVGWRPRRLLDLARFYLAEGMMAETIGVLEQALAAEPALAGEPEFRGLRGAANLLADRLDRAGEDLQSGIVEGFSDTRLWRAMLLQRRGAAAEALQALGRKVDVPAEYPHWVAIELGLSFVRAALDAADRARADKLLEQVEKAVPEGADALEARLLRGRVLAAAGRADEALRRYRDVADGPDRRLRAEARLLLAEFDAAAGAIDRATLVERLQQLRFAWRGGPWEMALLTRIASLQAEQGDYRAALHTYREAATGLPTLAADADTAAAMSDLFRRLFVEGGNGQMTAMQALATYEEFEELTPIGEEGDRLVARLADRLIDMDLLAEAARLLTPLVAQRLEGARKAEVGTRLVRLHLLDRNLPAARAALAQSAVTPMDAHLDADRRLLAAQIEIEAKETGRALAILKDDKSQEAALLRAAAYWRGERWSEAAAAIEAAHPGLATRTPPLGDGDADAAFRIALANNLAKDAAGLARTRARYAALMVGTPLADSFALVTAGVDSEGVAFRKLPAAVAQVDLMDAFLAANQKKARAGGN